MPVWIYATLLLWGSVTPERNNGSTEEQPSIWTAPPEPSRCPAAGCSGHAIYAHGTEALTCGTGQGKTRHSIGEEKPGCRAEMRPGAMPPVDPAECAFCLDVLSGYLQGDDTSETAYAGPNSELKCGVFVTWKKNGTLLGCIGTLSDVKYRTNLGKYALHAATSDRRFEPITELTMGMTVTVSRLGDWQTAETWDDWEIGQHGLILTVKVGGRTYSGTFLPEVAAEQSWTKLETIDHLLSKAGVPSTFHKAVEAAMLDSRRGNEVVVTLQTYRTERRTMTYAEYSQRMASPAA